MAGCQEQLCVIQGPLGRRHQEGSPPERLLGGKACGSSRAEGGAGRERLQREASSTGRRPSREPGHRGSAGKSLRQQPSSEKVTAAPWAAAETGLWRNEWPQSPRLLQHCSGPQGPPARLTPLLTKDSPEGTSCHATRLLHTPNSVGHV